jgi:hypothetical protein
MPPQSGRQPPAVLFVTIVRTAAAGDVAAFGYEANFISKLLRRGTGAKGGDCKEGKEREERAVSQDDLRHCPEKRVLRR